MSSEPQVTSSRATPNSTERILTRGQADRLPVFDVVGRWLHREPAFLHEHEPEHHLGELALMTVSAEWLTRWQPISMHRALLAGATPDQVAEAAGTSVRGIYEQWKLWADGLRRSLIAAFSIPVDTLPSADAAALLAQVLGTDPDGQQKADIAQIAQRLGGLPLAIRLTAARLRSHPAWTAQDLLDQDISQYTDLDRVYTLSYQDLNPGLRSFFRTLSVHPGLEITVEAAAMLTGTSLRAASASLEELYNRYLLAEPVPHRFRFHDLIKYFANREGSGMTDNEARQDALLRLLGYYAFMAESASQSIGMADLFTVPQPAGDGFLPTGEASVLTRLDTEASALNWLDTELGNLLSCAYYASGQSLLPYAWQIPASMTYYLRLRGFLGQAVSLLGGALEALENEADPLGEAIIRRRRGQLARLQGDLGLSRSDLNRSMQLARELGDAQGIAWCHHELGHLDWAGNDLADASDHFAQAAAINRDLGNTRGVAAAEMNLGAVLSAAGDTQRGKEHLTDALRIYTDSGSLRGRAASLYLLGALERDSGNYASAREMFTEALEIYNGHTIVTARPNAT